MRRTRLGCLALALLPACVAAAPPPPLPPQPLPPLVSPPPTPAPPPPPTASQPPALVGAGAATTDNSTAVTFGGTLADGSLAPADVWEFSPALNRWARLWDGVAAGSPPARTGHSASFAQGAGKLVVHGGRSRAGVLLGDTWVFDLCTPALRSAKPFSPFLLRSGGDVGAGHRGGGRAAAAAHGSRGGCDPR